MDSNVGSPGPDQVPLWVETLVPVAQQARTLLLRQLPYLGGAVLGCVTLIGVRPQPGPGLALLSVLLGTRLLWGAGRGSQGTPPEAGPSTTTAPGPVLADPQVARWAEGILLVVADIVGTTLGLVVWGTAAWRGAAQPLLTGILCAAALMAVVALGRAVALSLPACTGGPARRGGLAGLVCGPLVLAVILLWPGWAAAVGLVLVADGAGFLALRQAARTREAPHTPGT